MSTAPPALRALQPHVAYDGHGGNCGNCGNTQWRGAALRATMTRRSVIGEAPS